LRDPCSPRIVTGGFLRCPNEVCRLSGRGKARPVHAVRPEGWRRCWRPCRRPRPTGRAVASPARRRSCCCCPRGRRGRRGARAGRRPLAVRVWRPGGQAAGRRGWRIEPGDFDAADATLGFLLGAYRYERLKAARRPVASLAVSGQRRALSEAAATWMVRDLVNTPSNLLGPPANWPTRRWRSASVTARCRSISPARRWRRPIPPLRRWGAAARGRRWWAASSGRAATPAKIRRWWRCAAGRVLRFRWLRPQAVGVDVADEEGYGRRRQRAGHRPHPDGGGPAIRLAVRLGCVENSISGHAMRPLDVVRTRRGLTVEIGNTTPRGGWCCATCWRRRRRASRLVADCATLTGAARVAVGPDLPALFANDDDWAERLLAAGRLVNDPMWRLPLWDGYDSWLDSPVADLNNVSSKSSPARSLLHYLCAGSLHRAPRGYIWTCMPGTTLPVPGGRGRRSVCDPRSKRGDRK